MTMTTSLAELPGVVAWQRIITGDAAIAVAERDALGTSARIAVWPQHNLHAACAAVDTVLAALDQQASRFRTDSEICWIHRSGGGLFMLSPGLAEVVGVALDAARWTGGLTDPTVGNALISLGYDRDFAAIDQQRADLPAAPVKAPGWRTIQLDGVMMRVPAGVRLDLGATAKGVGSDRAAQAALSAGPLAGGVLVSLGGDISVTGTPPRDGWPVTVAEVPGPAGSPGGQLVRLPRGAIATSSTSCRQWRQAGQELHHIVDPRTGMPADGPWRTVTAVAATCADANAATTAAIVAGEHAERWLDAVGLPARLVARDGRVCYLGGWPDADGATAPVPIGSHVYRRPGKLRGIR
jgi:thiamine biosynthesis lipoprotein ApbE